MKNSNLTEEQIYWARALAALYRRRSGQYSSIYIQGIYEAADKDPLIHQEALRINKRRGRQYKAKERRW